MGTSTGRRRLRVLFLEPFYGGSHRSFADGLRDHSAHDIDLVTLPARFWKWRMRGAALHFSRAIDRPESYDLLFCSDMMSLADLAGIWGASMPPSVLYFHENQLSYPVPAGERIDYHFVFTNLTSAVAADRVLFNSRFHMEEFFSELERFLKRLPEYRPTWAVESVRRKSSVLYPGCTLSARTVGKDDVPLLIWNHRWEFDKQPEVFFRALERPASRGLEFNVALLGENFQAVPKPFLEAKNDLCDRIVQYGYVEDYSRYRTLLERGWVVVSTAVQENFGISVIEAVNAGCLPLLPDRLSYPELFPEAVHNRVLYRSEEELVSALSRVITASAPPDTSDLVSHTERYGWNLLAPEYDRVIEETAR